jgi:hypothetical protein
VSRLGNEAEEDETYFPRFKALITEITNSSEVFLKEIERLSKRHTGKIILSPEEEEEERNDVYIYKTLRYPSKSTPPTAT